MSDAKYVMTISRMTVDKLGVKLYDRVSAVIAELVANGYDADAREVVIEAPMGAYLASLHQGKIADSGYNIVVSDDGCGMEPGVVNKFYLKVGGERRKDPERGETSPIYHRKVMGRKGVGKLAPFGICNRIEVISSGGSRVSGVDKNGIAASGFRTAHFIMRRDQILSDDNIDYEPEIGRFDDTVRPDHGTTLIMSEFIRRAVPDMEPFRRQLAQRFGVRATNWNIKLIDSRKAPKSDEREAEVTGFTVETMDNTVLTFRGPGTASVDASRQDEFEAVRPSGEVMTTLAAGFSHSNGRFYPVTGWVAYAKQSYRDDLMAGVRIYCRGKIAAQTSLFNRKSGFTGEFDIRSYFVGELEADWLDEDEDLIQTDRRDIPWSDDLGQAFERWGQAVVQIIGQISRQPLKKKTWEEFLRIGNVEQRVADAYPGAPWRDVRDRTMGIAKLLGERLRPGEVEDQAYVNDLVQLSLMLARIIHNGVGGCSLNV